MARKLRLEFAGACYHVLNRGNYRRDLFVDGGAGSFERCLGEACGSFGWRLHAYGIMRNHFHLALETPEPNLSEGMKWLQGTWAVRFNRFRHECGRPFQGRFKALHIEPGHVLAQVAHYIHLNPLRAGIVPAEKLAEYKWGSLHVFPRKSRPPWLVPSTVLHESGGLADTPAGWRAYREYLSLLAEEDEDAREGIFQQLSRTWVVGSTAFRAGLRAELGRRDSAADRFQLLGADRLALLQARAEVWEEKLRGLAEALQVSLERLPLPKSAPEKVRLAAAMKATSSASNRWLAQRLQMGAASGVTSLVHRFLSSRRDDAIIYSKFQT